MVEVIKRGKALSVNPLKTSQTMGAAQAFLGINRSMPLLHGSQGCTAFGKVLFVRHYREPIPLQTTAMDQVSAVMGADENVVEALTTICTKQKPDVIGLLTTGLSETQGTDIFRLVKQFRAEHPEFDHIAVVPVNTPDFSGSFETGYANAVTAIIKTLVPLAEEAGTVPGRRKRQVNVIAGSHLTPGDVEALKELLEAFELRPLVLPDISDSLDGHLIEQDFTPLTVGGTPLTELAIAGDSVATLVIGKSMYAAADALQQRTGVPDFRFDHLMGLEANDELVVWLSEVADRAVPHHIARHRAQLQDAMVDCHFMLGQARIAIAAEGDEMLGMTHFLQSVGAEVVAAIVPTRGASVESLPLSEVKIGDLEDLEKRATEKRAELLIGNSHMAETAHRMQRPHLHMGFPQYDRLGGYQQVWIGYRGARRALFDMANILLHQNSHVIAPYRSPLAQKPEYQDGHAASATGTGH